MEDFLEILRTMVMPKSDASNKTGMNDTEKRRIADTVASLLGGFPVYNAGTENDAELIEKAKIPKAPSFDKPFKESEASRKKKESIAQSQRELGYDVTANDITLYPDGTWSLPNWGYDLKLLPKNKIVKLTTPVSDSYVDANGQRHSVFDGLPNLPDLKMPVTFQQAPRRRL